MRTPPIAFLLFIPLVAFVATLAITLAFEDGDTASKVAAPTTLGVEVESSVRLAISQPPVEQPPADRRNCSDIQGTAYRSDAERDWFQENCLNGASAESGTTGVVGGAAAADSGSATAAGGGGTVTSVRGSATVGGGEYATNDRLIIPRIGVNAPVNGVKVPASGAMSNPTGYFNAVWYDFSNFPGLGGYVEGNLVLSGHVDSARYGLAIFWHVRELVPGDTIQYVTASGSVVNYVVTASQAYSANTDFSGLVATGVADLTLITCTGTFSSGSYDLRHVVHARKS